jgi:hypothetical protein
MSAKEEQMRKTVSGFLSCGVIFALLLFHPQFPAAQSLGNTCTLNSLKPISGRSFAIDIDITNSDTLAGFQIPFSFNYGDIGITCDSVSFVSGRCQKFDCLFGKIDSTAKTVFLMGISGVNIDLKTPPLLPGSGKIATIYFSFKESPRNRMVNLKETKIPDKYRDFSFMFWDTRGEKVNASCNFGQVKF